MEGIVLPDDILQDIKRVSDEKKNEAQKSFIDGATPDGAENMPGQERPDLSANLDHFMKLVKWGSEAFDNIMKENNLPGLGKVSPDEFTKATKIWIEFEGWEGLAEQSPRILMGSIMTGVLVSNGVAFRRLNKKAKSETKTEE